MLLTRPDIDHLPGTRRFRAGSGNIGCEIVDVGKGTLLLAVAIDIVVSSLQQAVDKDADHVPVRIGDVLPWPIDIVGPDDHVLETVHLAQNRRRPFHSSPPPTPCQ